MGSKTKYEVSDNVDSCFRIFIFFFTNHFFRGLYNLFAPRSDQSQILPKFPNSLSKMLENKEHHVKVLPIAKRFHLKGYTTGFCPQTQELEQPQKTSWHSFWQ